MTLWPEWPFGQRHIGQRDSLASVTLAGDTLARVTFWPETLWPEWHFGQFFLLSLGYQRMNKKSIGGTIGKNLKKNNHHFSEKKAQIFFKFFPMVPPMEFLFTLCHTASFWNIIIQWTSHNDLTENISCSISLAKLVKWKKCNTAICDLTEKLLASYFVIFKSIWRPNAWMDPLEICFLLY
jgi:hypothetical protein